MKLGMLVRTAVIMDPIVIHNKISLTIVSQSYSVVRPAKSQRSPENFRQLNSWCMVCSAVSINYSESSEDCSSHCTLAHTMLSLLFYNISSSQHMFPYAVTVEILIQPNCHFPNVSSAFGARIQFPACTESQTAKSTSSSLILRTIYNY